MLSCCSCCGSFGIVVNLWFCVGVVVDRIDTVVGVAVWVGDVLRFSGARLWFWGE